MPDLVMGDRIRERVREFFKKGHKSGNKLYAINTDGSFDPVQWQALHVKALARYNHAMDSDRLRLPGMAYYALAQALIRVPITDRAGNCGEQAALSAWYALKTEFIRRDLIYIATITNPGDHVFCLVTDRPIANPPQAYASVRAFCGANDAPNYLVIDPWLNTSSAGDQYLLRAGQKLEEWQQDGKRVGWAHGRQGNGWYPPAGEYKHLFAFAPVSIQAF